MRCSLTHRGTARPIKDRLAAVSNTCSNLAMRWSGQQVLDTGVGADDALPGLRGLLRTVRPPEFAGTVLHEVEARSALNRVPGPSPLPFEWTVNPYRGCSHACVYCLAGPTRVLLPDGRTRPIARLRVGDVVLGTELIGGEADGVRRYAPTKVLAHWSTTKPAHLLRLRDGTEIVTSGEHRFLTDRGWRHATGGWCRSGRRPRLRPGSALLGPGPGAPPAVHTPGYRRGYLCGLVDADGPAVFPSAGLGLEALGRVHHFLSRAVSGERVRTGAPTAREPGRVPPPGPLGLPALADVLARPAEPGEDWCAGFLGGVLDARGEVVEGRLVVRHRDDAVVGRVAGALHRLGLRFAVTGGPGGPQVALAGGPAQLLRLLQLADPARASRLGLSGAPVEPAAGLEVESVSDLGVELPMYDITTGTGDFVAEGVVSHNCFARRTHTYLDMDAGADFDRQIVVKVNVARVLERELRSPRWAREPVAMGTNTDPYQRAEGRYRLMPGVIDALARSGTPFSVLTKGTVLTRDLPRLVSAAADVPVGLGVSVALLDRPLQARLEPGTPAPAARLDMVRRIADAGLPCGVMVAPVLPLLTDSPEALDALLARVAAAGAAGASVMALHLRRGAREWFMAWLAREHPALVGRYERLYRRGAYADPAYRRALAERVAPLLRSHGLRAGTGTLRHQPDAQRRPPLDPPGGQMSLL
jgi:DNA repair photolyase